MTPPGQHEPQQLDEAGDGVLLDENPLDVSEEFNRFLLACRHGDLRRCQELISQGVNINGRDRSDYTPLIIACLCGHKELVELLLESGALAEQNTFQGQRCLYNALTDDIRTLLLSHDYSKSSEPYVYWSTHVSSLLTRTTPRTWDIRLTAVDQSSHSFALHKFLLAARTPYFYRELEARPSASSWSLDSAGVPIEILQMALRYVYLGDLPRDLVPPGSSLSEEQARTGLDSISRQLEMESLWGSFLTGGDHRRSRHRFQDEQARAVEQFGRFLELNVLRNKVVVPADRVHDVKWTYDNPAYADVLLRADDEVEVGEEGDDDSNHGADMRPSPPRPSRSVIYPAHKAMLIRSNYFDKMFSGDFIESQRAPHLRIVTVDFSPAVLELVLTFLYTENLVCPLEHALDLLYAADMLFLDALKTKAAQAISTLGSTLVDRQSHRTATEVELINIYDVVHAAWDLRVRRLEEFAARYLAQRLEDYIDDPDFHNLIRESAERIQKRQETDTIELLDDIRYYLSERFRLRFQDTGLNEMMTTTTTMTAATATTAQEDAAKDTEEAQNRNSPPISPSHEPNGLGNDTNNARLVENNSAAASSQPGAVATLDGNTAEDEFASDAINFQILIRKIDAMLERLQLDA